MGGWKAILSFGAMAAAVYGIVVALMFVAQRRLLYFPDSRVPARVAHGAQTMDEVRIITADGLNLLAWYRPARVDGPTVLYLHGNAGHIGDRMLKARPFLNAGVGLLLLSYRGYGGNSGRLDEAGLIEDARSALAWLVGRGVPSGRIAVYGESLGCGPAVALAAETPVGAVILEAPFSSIADVAAYHFPWLPVRWLVRDRFESAARIGQVRAPILILHGTADETIPIALGRRLFAAANEPKEIKEFTGGGHNDLDAFGAGAVALDFLARWAR